MRANLQPRASAIIRWAATVALCRSSLAQTSSTFRSRLRRPTKHQMQAAEDAYLAGARMLERNDLAGAEIQFGKAAKLDPQTTTTPMAYAVTHQRHVTELVQESGKARLLGQSEKAETLLAEARLLDPQNAIVGQNVDPGRSSQSLSSRDRTLDTRRSGHRRAITLLPNPGVEELSSSRRRAGSHPSGSLRHTASGPASTSPYSTESFASISTTLLTSRLFQSCSTWPISSPCHSTPEA